ncbi:MAG: Gfo/Idh/MocA family oxidoreductase [Ilumatobacteraceae bacterium]
MNGDEPQGQLRIGVIGVAHRPHAMAYAHAASTLDATTLVGVFDDDREAGGAIADRYGVPFRADLDEFLDSGELEAVIVCNETSDHRRLVEAAARRGLHVLCEKPIATTLEDAATMIAACDAAGVQLHVAYSTRFYPMVVEARAAIEAGAIGDVVGMVGGNRGRPPLPPQYPAWITDVRQAGGGALLDHSVHVTDVMRHVLGREVVRVNAEVGDRFWSSGVDDMAAMSLVFDGGAIASVDPSWSVPERNPWSYDFFLRVLGTAGTITIDDRNEVVRLVTGDGLRLVPFGVDIDAAMIEAFARSVRSGHVEPPCAIGEDGYRSLEIALAGYRSATSHRTVQMRAGDAR